MDFASIFEDHFSQITPEQILLWGALSAVTALVLFHLKKQGKLQGYQVACLLGAFIYLYLVYLSTVFSRSQGQEMEYQLTPFWSYAFIIEYENKAVFQENILNLLLLLPAALLICEAARNKKAIKWITLGALAVSASIEVLQLVLRRGLFEWDDMFHNTLGVYLGCKLWCLLRRYSKTN